MKVKLTTQSTYAGQDGYLVKCSNGRREFQLLTSKAKYVCLEFDHGKFKNKALWFNRNEVTQRQPNRPRA